MPNSRISDLKEVPFLSSQSSMEPFPNYPTLPSGNLDDDVYFLIAREKSHNERIKYNSLKSSLVDCVVWLTGSQLISGQKVFADECTFLSRTNVNEILDFTLEGDISGNIFVGTTGLMQNLGLGAPFFERNDSPSFSVHVSGDSCFFGEFIHTGNSRQFGNLLRIGDSSLVGDFVVTGDSFIKGDEHFIGDKYQTGNILQIGDSHRSGDSSIRGQVSQVGNCYYTGDSWRLGDSTLIGDKKVTGDFYLFGEFFHTGDTFIKGDVFQSGNSFIEGDQTVTGDIYLGEYLYHLGDKDTYLRFTDDKIDLTAGSGVKLVMTEGTEDLITFFTSGEEQMRLTNQGFLGINTQDPIGELSVTGDSYLECVFTTGEDGKWERVFPGSDEVVSFVTALKRGSSSYKIDFPKTFGQDPAVSVSLENNQGASISPYFISGVTQSDFYLNFGTVLGSDGYRVHTSVRPTGQSAVNKTTTQSFKTNLPPGKDSYEIFFPNSFHRPPVVSSTIETSNLIMPHLISGISQNSYHILFGSTLPITYKIHTHAVR